MRRILLPVILVFFLRLDALAQLAANGKSLTVTTTNSIATFTGADLTGFKNQLTNENYLKHASAGELAAINPIASPTQSLQTSNWVIGTEAGTGVPIATITASDSTRSMTLTVKIDAATQETVVASSASITSAGLRDSSWSIAGLDLAGGHLIVPGENGLVFDKDHSPVGVYMQYPTYVWNAQMSVYETAQGSFLFYSTDPFGRFKQLRTTSRGSSSVDLAIVTEAIAPFPSATSTPSIEWRLKAFSGDWRNAAQVYRNWLAVNRPPTSDSAHPWVSGIRTVVSTRSLDTSFLSALAATVVPSKTLLYVFDWRASAYDVNYPDYTPRAGAGTFITAAQNLGFRVMLHCDAYGVSPGNADYASLQAFQARKPETLELDGWFWDMPPSTIGRFAYINPASSAFRSLFVTRVGAAIAAVHPDAIHLDVSSGLINDGNGLIEGLTFAQGAAQLHQDLITAFPNVAIGGEGENDVLYRYQSFAQTLWLEYPPMQGHPISTFLFNQKTQYYGHLSQPNTQDPAFKVFLSRAMRRGVLPNLSVGASADVDTTNPDIARFVGIVQSWQTNGFQLDMSGSWAGSLVRFAGSGNTVATLTDTGSLETLTAAGTVLYQLGHDTSQISTSTAFIPGWPAFDNSTLFGLDRTQQYWLKTTSRPDVTHVTSLPDFVRVSPGTLITSKAAHIELQRDAAAPFDFVSQLLNAVQGVAYQGSDFPLANGASVFATYSTVGGIQRQGIFMHPPFQGQIGGESFAEWSIPIGGGMKFQFSNGIQDGASCNVDGLTFRVTVNGAEVYKQNYGIGAWHDGAVDLNAYANSTIQLRIIDNPGPQNNPNCDWGVWSQLALVHSTAQDSFVSIPMTLASGSTFSGSSGDGSVSLNSPLSAAVSSVPLPAEFTVFTQAGAAVSNGINIANLTYETFQAATGALAWSVTCCSPSSATVGGVTKSPAIFAHPPTFGRTILAWTLQLPNSGPLRLGWSVGILDGAMSADGVDYFVMIDGISYWQYTATGNVWVPGSVDLSPWRGKNILLELVTDSRANFLSDWAQWADLVISNSVVTCGFSLSPTSATVTAQGAQGLANVAAPATCPWFAKTTVPWISVSSGGSGTGNGSVSYSVNPNASAPRFGSLSIAGKTLTISQSDSNGILPRKSRTQITSQ